MSVSPCFVAHIRGASPCVSFGDGSAPNSNRIAAHSVRWSIVRPRLSLWHSVQQRHSINRRVIRIKATARQQLAQHIGPLEQIGVAPDRLWLDFETHRVVGASAYAGRRSRPP
jgi:hypothetical protein